MSIINLETVEDVAAAAGAEVDHRRFRANIYLQDLPAWDELNLVGHRLRVGSTVLEVTAPIQRCRAISVHPDRQVRDLPLPAILAGAYGHLHCGVYARVVSSGIVRDRDACVDLGRSIEPVAEPAWPRRVEVVDRVKETDDVLSLWLRDPAGLAHEAAPGQHIRILAHDSAGPIWRCYTVSGCEPDRFRITVKLRGQMADRLLGGELRMSGPHGRAVVEASGTRALVLISAGTGITPTVAILRSLADKHGPVRVLHVDRGRAALRDEVEDHVRRLDDAQAVWIDTTGPAGRRPTSHDVGDLVRGGVSKVLVCGPEGFAAEVIRWLGDAGVDPRLIVRERFYSPRPLVEVDRRDPPRPGPFNVRLGPYDLRWTAEDGSLLDLGDAMGVDLPSGCRSGMCGECEQLLVSGQVAHLVDPLMPTADDRVLLCSVVPLGDVVLTAHPGD